MYERDTLLPQIIDDLPMGYAYHRCIYNELGEAVDYLFLDVNKTFEELTGLKREEIMGEKATTILPGLRDEFDWVSYYGEVARGGETREFEEYAVPLKRWYSVKAFSPKPGYVITCFWDITTEKEAREECETFLRLSNDIVFELNDEYVFVNCWSNQPERLFWPVEEFLGRSYMDLFSDELKEKTRKALEEAKVSQKRVSFEYQSPNHDDGHWYQASILSWISRYHKRKYLVSILEITEEKKKKRGMGVLLEIADYLIHRPLGAIDSHLYQVINQYGLKLSEAKASAFYQYNPREDIFICRSLVALDDDFRKELESLGICDGGVLSMRDSFVDRLETREKIKEFTLLGFMEEYRETIDIEIMEREVQIERVLSMDLMSSSKFLGQFLLFYSKKTPVENPDLLKIFHGITGEYLQHLSLERELKESQERYEEVVQSQKSMICRFKPDTRLTFVNQAYSQLFRRRPEELIGRRFLDFIPTDEHEEVLSHIQRLHYHQPTNTYRHSVKLPDGSKGWQEWTDRAFFDDDGSITEIQSVGIDITELKESRDKAIEASKEKSEFLTRISHELRTPLHAILSYAGLGEEESKDLEDHESKKYFNRIAISGRRLLYLINDILDLSKMETGTLDYSMKREDLYEMILQHKEELLPLIKEKKHSLVIDRPSFSTTCLFHGEKILQVIRNLVQNASKFSPYQSTIRITFSQVFDSISYLAVHVEDEGIGIPDKDLSTIFTKFKQSSQPLNKSGGMGLGLTISQEIIKAHGGKIYAQNIEEGGARVTFLLPDNQSP